MDLDRHFSASIDIDAPPSRVWEVMADPERWHEWTPSITRIHLLGGRSLAIGTRAQAASVREARRARRAAPGQATASAQGAASEKEESR